ncbi:hypothetical protein OFN97_05265 [Campylobacter sp. VBCF_05 NA6]|uniref:hypothetical protein n=1 Tax=unclassified Campylobacter TaxID=2593542 RepID=UPI0022E9E86D|nr:MULTISPECIES: hypothetical protein [unclassified Campylobacter]MDA3058023.1 hypothetical protein [Campylobacter sp. VBCF_04 NA7]MDA3059422.1 hypothetical protein [Campylobacter sp. VBCF_05 NA6]
MSYEVNTANCWFKIILLVCILIYLYFELRYNFDMLNAASASASQELKAALEELEIRGHRVSSIGLTLFCISFIFGFFIKFDNIPFAFIATIVLSIVMYNSIYVGLNKAMDYLVEKNQDKRFEAYYINGLKYAILNGNFGFETYLSKNHIEDIKTSVEAKVLASNIFLLTFVDTGLSNRVKTSSEQFAEELYLNSEFMKTKEKENTSFFITKAHEIKQGYEEYNYARKQINAGVEKGSAMANNGENEYKKFTQKINKKLDDYTKGSQIYITEKQKHMNKIDQYYADLKNYFRYRPLSEKKYKQSMQKNFGHYIKPSSWCYKGVCPHREAIAATIDKEAKAKWNKQSSGVPAGLSQKEFLKHPKVKSAVIAELRKNGLNVGNNFNYSRSQFLEAYNRAFNSAFNSKYNANILEFRSKFAQKTGIENVDLNLDWEGFVSLFKPQFKEKLENSDTYANEAVGIVISGQLGEFYDKVFKPIALDKFDPKKYFYSKYDFRTNQNAMILGDKALRALYIPPFAIVTSIFSATLNLINLIVLMFIIPFCRHGEPRGFSLMIKIVLIVLLIVIIGCLSPNYLRQNVAINQLKNNEHGLLYKYLGVLDSIIYLENLNYKLPHKTK